MTSSFVAGPYSLSFHFKAYYRKEKCNELELEFKSKVEIAKDFVTEYLEPNDIDLVTINGLVGINGKEYRVYRYEAKVGFFDNAVLLISYEITEYRYNNSVYILCTDITLSTEPISRYYSVRWTIETSNQYLKKNLEFD